jgi:hypothetical protein
MILVSAEVQQAFADTVLPGSARWPKASEVITFPIQYLEGFEIPEDGQELEILNQLLTADSQARHKLCVELEKLQPSIFQTLLTRIFAAYYSNLKVLSLIEEKHSYPARPPMPIGQVFLKTEAPPVLPAATTPLWRKDGTKTAEKVYGLQAIEPRKDWTLEEIMTWHS